MTNVEIAQQVIAQAEEVGYWRSATHTVLVDGAPVELVRTGHNATHDWWFGITPEDQVVQYVECCGEPDSFTVLEEGYFPSYIGHY